jgi:hypothetical protein
MVPRKPKKVPKLVPYDSRRERPQLAQSCTKDQSLKVAKAPKKTHRFALTAFSLRQKMKEAPPGFEPGHNGFAIRSLSHLGTAPCRQVT